jgi:hypothetical protein
VPRSLCLSICLFVFPLIPVLSANTKASQHGTQWHVLMPSPELCIHALALLEQVMTNQVA